MNTIKATRHTEKRHSQAGNTCHHFTYHRLTCDEYDLMRRRARGHCEMCGTPESETGGKRLVVDHFEGAGLRIIRGLICDRCNAVMACMDGRKRWGPKTRPWREAAERYQLTSWTQPTPAQRALMDSIQAQRSVNL